MQTGNFGHLRQAYTQARLPFPEGVIRYIVQYLPLTSAAVLDVGCGTGIGTRQLHEKGLTVIGSDIDSAMIEEAQKASPSISYVLAPAL